MVPIGKHIFSFGIISSVLSFVWYVIYNKHAEDYIIIYLSKSGCKEMDIKIIDISVNIDHVHLFIQYPPKYLSKFYCKEDQRTI